MDIKFANLYNGVAKKTNDFEIPVLVYFRSGLDPNLPESEREIGTVSDIYLDDRTGDLAVDVWCGDALCDGWVKLDPDTIK